MTDPVLIWDENGLPHSVNFDDKYFCKENGYEETLYVSCQGNRLSDRFQALNPSREGIFTIIETGFGTGLNFCCAWKVFEENAPKSWKLRFISLEKFPISNEQLLRALSLWPLLETYKLKLAAQYQPSSLNNTKEWQFDEGRIQLVIVFDDVLKALKIMDDKNMAPQGADAWFLDGFAPAKNPEMWADRVYQAMALLSRPGISTLATFTVAGFVRRGLDAAGFRVEKWLGYGIKKHVLIGTYKGPCSWGGCEI